jgi:hypothetical protein
VLELILEVEVEVEVEVEILVVLELVLELVFLESSEAADEFEPYMDSPARRRG